MFSITLACGQQGFIHVRGLLSPELVQRCNSALDANMDALEIDEALIGEGALENTPLGGSVGYERAWTGMLSWPSPHCDPWRELLAHQGPSPQPTHVRSAPVCLTPGRLRMGWRAGVIPYLNTLLGRGWKLGG